MSEDKLPPVPDEIVLDEMISEELPSDESQLEKTEVLKMSDLLAELGVEEEVREETIESSEEIEFSSSEEDLPTIPTSQKEEIKTPITPPEESLASLSYEDIEQESEPVKAELPPSLKWLQDVDLQQELNWLEHLNKLSELKKLDELNRLQDLSRLDRLERLEHLNKLDELKNLASLNKIDELKQLELLHQLDKLQELRILNRLDDLSKLDKLDVLDNLKNLESLQILASKETQDTLNKLEKLDKVDELRGLLNRRGLFIMKGVAMVLVNLLGIALISLLIVYGLFTSEKKDNLLKVLSFLSVDEKMITDFSFKTLEKNLDSGEFKEFVFTTGTRGFMLIERFWNTELPYSVPERASIAKAIYSLDYNSEEFPLRDNLISRMASMRQNALDTFDRSFERLKREQSLSETEESLLLEYKILTHKGQCDKASEVVWNNDLSKFRTHEFIKKSILLNLDCGKGADKITKSLEKL